MRQRTNNGWFFRLTFAVPMVAAVSLLGLLGVIAIADLCGGGAFCSSAWKVFLGASAGLLGLVFLSRVVVLLAAALGLIILTVHRAAHGAALLVRTTLRGV